MFIEIIYTKKQKFTRNKTNLSPERGLLYSSTWRSKNKNSFIVSLWIRTYSPSKEILFLVDFRTNAFDSINRKYVKFELIIQCKCPLLIHKHYLLDKTRKNISWRLEGLWWRLHILAQRNCHKLWQDIHSR